MVEFHAAPRFISLDPFFAIHLIPQGWNLTACACKKLCVRVDQTATVSSPGFGGRRIRPVKCIPNIYIGIERLPSGGSILSPNGGFLLSLEI